MQRKALELQAEGLKLQEKQIEEQEGGGKVICTELYEQGYMPLEILKLDCKYREFHIDNGTYAGYRIWADPIVKRMKKSKWFTNVVSWFALPCAYEVAHRMDSSIEGNWLGAFLLKVGVPFCKRLWIRDCIKKMREVQHG